MDTARIRMGHPYGQTPRNIFSDFDWVRRHEKELLAQYGECCIIVYQEQVIGTGDSMQSAIEDAEHNLPPEVGAITPICEWLFHRHPILRVQPTPIPKSNSVKK